MATAKPIPYDRRGAIPYLTVLGAARAIDFYADVFGATEQLRIPMPGDRIGHAELAIGDAVIMLSDEYPEMGVLSPDALGGTPVTIHLYVADVDAVVARATAAGATLTRPVEDQFYGDRAAKLVDPFGHAWWLATRQEDVSGDEMLRRSKALYG